MSRKESCSQDTAVRRIWSLVADASTMTSTAALKEWLSALKLLDRFALPHCRGFRRKRVDLSEGLT